MYAGDDIKATGSTAAASRVSPPLEGDEAPGPLRLALAIMMGAVVEGGSLLAPAD